jgi:hypothetical protein
MLCDLCQGKQSQTKPITVSPQHCWGLIPCLKKQSQFANWQIGVMSDWRGVYDNIPPYGERKNKAKQTQFNGSIRAGVTVWQRLF